MGLPGLAGCVDYGLNKLEGELAVEPGEIRFGDVEVGEVATESFRIWNTGDATLEVTGIQLEGASFTIVDPDWTGKIPAKGFYVVDVVYTPTSEEGDIGWATVTASGDQTAEVLLNGRALPITDPGTGGSDDPVTEVALGDGEMRTLEIQFTVSGGLDVAFLLDTTRSMDSLIDSMKSEFDGIAEALDASFLQAGFGLATFDDYAMYPYGSLGTDLPYQLRTPMTDDRAAMAAALAGAEIHEGQDAPESTMEALVQALTGRGYDQDCDGVLDPDTDVPPFKASDTDAFGGTVPGVGGGGDGGFGFRDGQLPVIVYATNYELRDADDPRYNTPGGCPKDAGLSDVVQAAGDLDAKLIGVAVQLSESSYAFSQMQALGEATGSLADLDSDGDLEPAAFSWSGESASFRDSVVQTVQQLVGAMQWQMVWIEYEDPHGIVVDVQPTVRTDVSAGETVTFQITLRGTPLEAPVDLTFKLMGDDGLLLAQQVVTVTYAE